MPTLTIERSEVELESSFAPRLWALVHDTPALYDALLDELQPAGLSSMDLRPDAGDGSVGGASLGFWLFGGKTNVRMGLDGVRYRSSFLRSDVMDAVDGVTAAMRRAVPAGRYLSHAFSYAGHGLVEGAKSTQFVHRFALGAL